MKSRHGRTVNQGGSNLSLRKGITPVIAVVLLLMITVALLGFAFIWFQGVWESVAESTEESVVSEVSRMAQTIKIDNVLPGNVDVSRIYIRSTGSQSIDVTDITVYVNDAKVECTWDGTITTIPAKGVGGCDPSLQIVSGNIIKVTSPGTSQGDVVTVS